MGRIVFSQDWLSCVVQKYGPLITPGAILISAGVAICVMVYNAKIARRRATVDLVLHLNSNDEWNKARKKVLELHEKDEEFLKYALKEHSKTEENSCILSVLNTNEFIAVGIREGAFDENTYKRLRRRAFIRDWNALETFVKELDRKSVV